MKSRLHLYREPVSAEGAWTFDTLWHYTTIDNVKSIEATGLDGRKARSVAPLVWLHAAPMIRSLIVHLAQHNNVNWRELVLMRVDVTGLVLRRTPRQGERTAAGRIDAARVKTLGMIGTRDAYTIGRITLLSPFTAIVPPSGPMRLAIFGGDLP